MFLQCRLLGLINAENEKEHHEVNSSFEVSSSAVPETDASRILTEARTTVKARPY